jgi:hypothetical protein
MISYDDLKKCYCSNIILFILILFVIIYVIINLNKIHEDNYWNNDYIKPILLTGILILILHLIFTWDDKNNLENQEVELNIPKYKLGQDNIVSQNNIILENTEKIENKIDIINNDIIDKEILNKDKLLSNNSNINSINKLNSKYRIINKLDHPSLKEFNKLGNNISEIKNKNIESSNQNIFVSFKNSNKYGIKFI